MKHTVTLTQEELLAAARYFYNIPPQAEIVVADEKPQDEGWISNVGRDKNGYPETLRPDTKIEVKDRNGNTKIGFANSWYVVWREVDGFDTDIVAYRVIK